MPFGEFVGRHPGPWYPAVNALPFTLRHTSLLFGFGNLEWLKEFAGIGGSRGKERATQQPAWLCKSEVATRSSPACLGLSSCPQGTPAGNRTRPSACRAACRIFRQRCRRKRA